MLVVAVVSSVGDVATTAAGVVGAAGPDMKFVVIVNGLARSSVGLRVCVGGTSGSAAASASSDSQTARPSARRTLTSTGVSVDTLGLPERAAGGCGPVTSLAVSVASPATCSLPSCCSTKRSRDAVAGAGAGAAVLGFFLRGSFCFLGNSTVSMQL